jgi:hypothetical protein
LGEHKELINAFDSAVGANSNLASYELNLAKHIDLLIIFPDSPGSFVELGMFSISEAIARKMIIFIKEEYKERKSFVMYGAVALAAKHKASIITVKYKDLEQIWQHVLEAIRERRQKQLDKQVLAGS